MQKVVDNYQFDQNNQKSQNGIQIYPAQHIKTKQSYTLKRLNIKGNPDKNIYQGLLNQVAILKQFDHPNIIKCHKMLKTPNNIYLVYDFYSENSLQSVIQNKKLQKSQKENYVKQICLGLRQMKRRRVVHLNLNPKNIYIDNNGVIKITDFIYSDQIDSNSQANLTYLPSKTQFLAPQIISKQEGTFASDAYSFGKILLFMDFHLQQNGNKTVQNQQIVSIIKGFVKKQPSQRHSIQQVQSILLKSSNISKSRTTIPMNDISQSQRQSRSPRKMPSTLQIQSSRKITQAQDSPSKQPTSALLKSTRSKRQINPMAGSKRQASPMPSKNKIPLKQQNQSIFEFVVLQVMKKRNLSIFLLNLSQTCTKIVTNNAISMSLGYMFLKKSTNVLSNIIGFLQTGKNDHGIQLSSKQRQQFFKTSDYFKLSSILNAQMNSQKKWLTEMAIIIQTEGDQKKMQEKFKHELQTQKFDEYYLKSIILDQKALKVIQKDTLVNLQMMSKIFEFNSFQKLFEQHINDTVFDMKRQQLYVHIIQQDSGELIEGIKKKLKKFSKSLQRQSSRY